MSLGIGLRAVSRWRVFAGIVFLNQIVRVPLLLSLADSVKDLEVYFIVSATSIPVQFIAQDILQYRSRLHRPLLSERLGLAVLALGSIAYVAWYNGMTTGVVYVLFSTAVLLHGASVGHVRDVFPASRVLAMDALYNSCTTVLFVISAMFLCDNPKLGYAIVLSQAGVAILICGLNLLTARGAKSIADDSTSVTEDREAKWAIGPLVLASIMATTQLERLIIAVSQPVVLACISLAAGGAQAWRKMGLDDAVVFEKLQSLQHDELYHAMCSELKYARYVFYPPLLLTIFCGFYIKEIADWCAANGVLRSLDQSSFAIAVAILSVYLSIMPAGIVMINTVRQRVVRLHKSGWVALIVVATLELVALVFPSEIMNHVNLAMAIIILTASLSFSLFIASCPAKLGKTLRHLRFDIVIFLIIVCKLI